MKSDIQKISAGIVTFNPDIDRLCDNVKAILTQVTNVCIVDNGSKNIGDIKKLAKNYSIVLFDNKKNKGISFALNRVMEFSLDVGANWCITLDQDSVVPNNLIKESLKYMGNTNVGEIAPTIVEKKTGVMPSLDTPFSNEDFQYVNKCITSSTITNVEIWKKLGGFDESFFIDYVDFDYSAKLIDKGYKIIRMNNVFLDHELGDSKLCNFFFKKIRVANHSAFRKYYICRNILIFIRKKYSNVNNMKELLRLLKVIIVVILYEEDKIKKLSACLKGIIDGINFNIKDEQFLK